MTKIKSKLISGLKHDNSTMFCHQNFSTITNRNIEQIEPNKLPARKKAI